MSDRKLFMQALAEMGDNLEQLEAVQERGHCVVLAGPGSGKTKTLTTAMARCILDDVKEPRGVACITYNNECALELEARLSRLGVEPSDRVFVGTVHSFALTQVTAHSNVGISNGLVGYWTIGRPLDRLAQESAGRVPAFRAR